MPLTHFPNGIASFGMPIVGIGEETMSTGKVFFVHHSGSGRGTVEAPFTTINDALSRCVANRGDIVFVMPGHSEDPLVSIAMDKAGVWVRGLGWGNDRPTVTFGALAACVEMSAASCRISNIIFDLGVVAATVTNCFNITAAGVIVEKNEIKPHATSQFTNFLTATDVEDVTIRNNRFRSLETAGSTSGLVVDGCDHLQIIGNEVSGHFGEMALDNTTPASCDEILRATIVGNIFINYSSTAGDLVVELDANATGVMAYNGLSGGLAFASNVDYGNMLMIQNYLVDAVDVTAIVSPTTPAS
jgi:hypothetical protein